MKNANNFCTFVNLFLLFVFLNTRHKTKSYQLKAMNNFENVQQNAIFQTYIFQ